MENMNVNCKVVPITDLTGFLGAGKTMLLNRILTGAVFTTCQAAKLTRRIATKNTPTRVAFCFGGSRLALLPAVRWKLN